MEGMEDRMGIVPEIGVGVTKLRAFAKSNVPEGILTRRRERSKDTKRTTSGRSVGRAYSPTMFREW